MSRWWCMDCQAEVALNRSGRCGACDSEAVDPIGNKEMTDTAAAVEQPSLAMANAGA